MFKGAKVTRTLDRRPGPGQDLSSGQVLIRTWLCLTYINIAYFVLLKSALPKAPPQRKRDRNNYRIRRTVAELNRSGLGERPALRIMNGLLEDYGILTNETRVTRKKLRGNTEREGDLLVEEHKKSMEGIHCLAFDSRDGCPRHILSQKIRAMS